MKMSGEKATSSLMAERKKQILTRAYKTYSKNNKHNFRSFQE